MPYGEGVAKAIKKREEGAFLGAWGFNRGLNIV